MNEERLFNYCTTDRQREILTSYLQNDCNGEAAGRELNLAGTNVHRLVRILKKRSAIDGHAPGHWDSGTASGYKMGKVTVQRDPEFTCPGCGMHIPDKVRTQWERQHPDDEVFQEILDTITERAESVPPIDEMPEPEKTLDADLCTNYTIADIHLGMLAWGKEGGEPWDLKISTKVLRNAIHRLTGSSPDSELAILTLLGDFMHWDGINAVTPAANNLLDADIRYPKLQYAALEITEWTIKELLKKHKKVRLIECEGNHDPASSSWIRIAMQFIFANNPRVEIDLMPCPYNAFLFGKIMLAFHHGHKKKDKSLPGVFAAEPRYREMWGQAKYTYIHTGHYHSSQMILSECNGAIVERHPTLAARDAYAVGLGAVTLRSAKSITYHKDRGEVHRVTVYPEYEHG